MGRDHGDGVRSILDKMGIGGLGLIASLRGEKRGNVFPAQDALDLIDGAEYIPGEVTNARRAGHKVRFTKLGSNKAEWYWELPDGRRVKHGSFHC